MNSSIAPNAAYGDLLQKRQPRVIRSDEQNEQYIEWLEELSSRTKLTKQEQELADLLTVLIDDFESKKYALRRADPVEIIRELMRARGLRQKDMLDVFATPSLASEILNRRRGLTLAHVRKLSEKFNVSADLFV